MTFSDAVYWLVRQIPSGRVMADGQVATALGYPRAARAVGSALHFCSEDIPWWRVVNRRGQVTTSPTDHSFQRQVAALRSEGVAVDENGALLFVAYEWWPTPDIEEKVPINATSGRLLDQAT